MVEHRNGIAGVRGSNPLGSRIPKGILEHSIEMSPLEKSVRNLLEEWRGKSLVDLRKNAEQQLNGTIFKACASITAREFF